MNSLHFNSPHACIIKQSLCILDIRSYHARALLHGSFGFFQCWMSDASQTVLADWIGSPSHFSASQQPVTLAKAAASAAPGSRRTTAEQRTMEAVPDLGGAAGTSRLSLPFLCVARGIGARFMRFAPKHPSYQCDVQRYPDLRFLPSWRACIYTARSFERCLSGCLVTCVAGRCQLALL